MIESPPFVTIKNKELLNALKLLSNSEVASMIEIGRAHV